MKKISKNERSASKVASMTGYGLATGNCPTAEMEVELRTSNGRYLDVQVRLPRILSDYEIELREKVQGFVKRGRVEVFINRTPKSAVAPELKLNRLALDKMAKLYREIGKHLNIREDLVNESLLRDALTRKEVLSFQEARENPAAEKKLAATLLERALKSLTQCRIVEGAKLLADIQARLSHIGEILAEITKSAALRPQVIREKLIRGLSKVASDLTIDAQRLAAEVAIVAERADVSEELTRMAAHIGQFNKTLSSPPAGKKLDFIVQEMVRELNTIGSKVQDSKVQGLIVDAKSEVERIREQIQNLE